jgi:hypothetical protein
MTTSSPHIWSFVNMLKAPDLLMNSSLRIPAFLIGTQRDVWRRWRPIFERALKDGSWAAALAGESWVPLDEFEGPLICREPHHDADENCLMLYLLHEAEFRSPALRRQGAMEYCRSLNKLRREGFHEFWFCLASVVEVVWFPSRADPFPDDFREVARLALSQFLRYWDTFVSLDSRFVPNNLPEPYRHIQGWALWNSGPISLCKQLFPELTDDDLTAIGRATPERAGEIIQALLRG